MIFADLVKLCVEMVRAERKWEVSGKLDDDAWHKLVNLKLDLDQAISPSATEWSRPGRVLLCAMFEPINKIYRQLATIASKLDEVDEDLAEDIRSILDELWYMTPHELLKSNSGN